MQNLVAAVNEVISKAYPEVSVKSFHFDSFYQVGRGEVSADTIPLVFGSSLFWRWKQHYRNLRKKKPFKTLELKLPDDAIFFYRDDKQGFIIASPKYDFVLKIFLDPPHKLLLDREILTLKGIKGSNFERFASTYYSDGLTTNGARWVLTDFRGNSDSIRNHYNFEKYWYEISYQEIMPRIVEFYKSNGPEFIAVKDWVASSEKRTESHPDREKILSALKEISSLDDGSELLESAIHYDLHAGNVLRSKDNYSIIDWEGNLRGLVLIDAFDFLRRFVQKNRSQYRNLKSLCESTFHDYREWLEKHFEVSLNENSCKLHFLIYAVERSLLFWEVRAVNRLKDKNAIEKHLIGRLDGGD